MIFNCLLILRCLNTESIRLLAKGILLSICDAIIEVNRYLSYIIIQLIASKVVIFVNWTDWLRYNYTLSSMLNRQWWFQGNNFTCFRRFDLIQEVFGSDIILFYKLLSFFNNQWSWLINIWHSNSFLFCSKMLHFLHIYDFSILNIWAGTHREYLLLFLSLSI